LFVTCIGVPAVTLLQVGSLSDYVVRRRLMAGGLAAGAGGCVLFLIGEGVGPLFAAGAFQGLAVGLTSGAAGAALLDLRPDGGAAPLVSSAALTGGQALGAVGVSALAQCAPAPTHLACCCLAPLSSGSRPCWRCRNLEGAPRRRGVASPARWDLRG
jgi:MFS family permease